MVRSYNEDVACRPQVALRSAFSLPVLLSWGAVTVFPLSPIDPARGVGCLRTIDSVDTLHITADTVLVFSFALHRKYTYMRALAEHINLLWNNKSHSRRLPCIE